MSPLHSPAPPFGKDPYSDFGEFLYSTTFVTTYLSMPPASKRSFETGKILEDTIFHHVRSTPPGSKWLKGSPILRWIIDIDDIEVKKWFAKAERIELKSWGPPLPPCDLAFEYAVGIPRSNRHTVFPLQITIGNHTYHRSLRPSKNSGTSQNPDPTLSTNPL